MIEKRLLDRRWFPWSIAGAVFCCGALSLNIASPIAAMAGWLVGWLFFCSLPIGGLFLSMMMSVIPGTWREKLFATTSALHLLLPVALLATLPLFVGFGDIHKVASSAALGAFHLFYMAPIFVLIRTIVFFAACIAIALYLNGASKQMKPIAVSGLIVLTLLHMLMATDWAESLTPDFHSSGFALYFLSIQMTIALCVAILWVSQAAKTGDAVLGNLLLVALLFWSYLAFMQYFIIWSENLPHQVAWYLARGTGFWAVMEYIIAATHLIPLVMLLFPPVRQSRCCLIVLAASVLVGKMLEIAWLIFPAIGGGVVLMALAAGLTLLGFGCFSVVALSASSGPLDSWRWLSRLRRSSI